MNDRTDIRTDLRGGLIAGLLAARATEGEVFAALDPNVRDAPAPDGSWSPKDIQAHLSMWRQRQSDRLAALREGVEEPALAATETDEINAIFHADRADWSWEQVLADADATTAALVEEVRRAGAETIANDRVAGSIMGNGSEHTIAHLPPIAASVRLESRLFELAATIEAIFDEGDWPSRPAAFGRYNLACFYALNGRLGHARALLRRALPEQEELRSFAPGDDDLIALREEIPSLIEG